MTTNITLATVYSHSATNYPPATCPQTITHSLSVLVSTSNTQSRRNHKKTIFQPTHILIEKTQIVDGTIGKIGRQAKKVKQGNLTKVTETQTACSQHLRTPYTSSRAHRDGPRRTHRRMTHRTSAPSHTGINLPFAMQSLCTPGMCKSTHNATNDPHNTPKDVHTLFVLASTSKTQSRRNHKNNNFQTTHIVIHK